MHTFYWSNQSQHPPTFKRRLRNKFYLLTGKWQSHTVEEQVGWEIFLCPSWENAICNILEEKETWRRVIGGRGKIDLLLDRLAAVRKGGGRAFQAEGSKF